MKTNAFKLCLLIPTHIDTSIDSTVCHLPSLVQALLDAAWLHATGASLGMCKLGYLQFTSRIPESDFNNSGQNNGVKQHSEQSRKPFNQQWNFEDQS